MDPVRKSFSAGYNCIFNHSSYTDETIQLSFFYKSLTAFSFFHKRLLLFPLSLASCQNLAFVGIRFSGKSFTLMDVSQLDCSFMAWGVQIYCTFFIFLTKLRFNVVLFVLKVHSWGTSIHDFWLIRPLLLKINIIMFKSY